MNVKLNGGWFMTFDDLDRGPEQADTVLGRTEGWMKTDLPCDIHMPLIESGIIRDPVIGQHCTSAEWVEQKSWWFKKSFHVAEQLLNKDRVELHLESLDVEADVFLNGQRLGHHRSAFYPFDAEIKQLLHPGENVLAVRLSTGAEHYAEENMELFAERIGVEKVYNRGEPRRIYLRKPQYAFGWDWGPRVASCGIVGDVYLRGCEGFAIRNVRSSTKSIARTADGCRAELRFEAEVEQFHPYSTLDSVVRLELKHEGKPVYAESRSVLIPSGSHYIDFKVDLSDARLWWPNGMGTPDLYEVELSVSTEKQTEHYPPFRFGIRQIELNHEALNRDERLFALMINGVRAFCKGANWIPADSIYARVSDEKYRELVSEAKEANFNMLRVWGGGLYEREAFYSACDENGIMVWQDFMFACALYPDDYAWFQEEVAKEIEYQTTRLHNHSSIVLWCGNNENHWNFDGWKSINPSEEFRGGEIVYNRIAPRIVRRNCPGTAYWNSSPFGGEHPNGEEMGDCHYWHGAMMSPHMENRITPEIYDGIKAKFVSEYGYIGPCRLSTITRYHDGEAVDRNGPIWMMHTNTFEKETVAAGISKQYKDAALLDLEQYLLYAGLCQGLMYGYSLEAMRYKAECSGGLFWMYNDCWGEIGWSIIDYELRRKLSYYFVKRAFEPVAFIAREQEGTIGVVGINETVDEVRMELEYGYVSFDGSRLRTRRTSVTLPPYSRGTVLTFERDGEDPLTGCWFASPISNNLGDRMTLPAAILRTGPFRHLSLPKANLAISDYEEEGENIRFTVTSDRFAHAVHFRLDDGLRLSDEYFDLLPGQSKSVTIYRAADKVRKSDLDEKASSVFS